MSSRDPKEPFDSFYYWNNQQEFPQVHSKQTCLNVDPFGKDKKEAELVEFEKYNQPCNARDYLNNDKDKNPSAPLYKRQ
jgi:hypothetical protein